MTRELIVAKVHQMTYPGRSTNIIVARGLRVVTWSCQESIARHATCGRVWAPVGVNPDLEGVEFTARVALGGARHKIIYHSR